MLMSGGSKRPPYERTLFFCKSEGLALDDDPIQT